MPSVHLRLTEEELAQLQKWAADGHRSLQKEAVLRLFQKHSGEIVGRDPEDDSDYYVPSLSKREEGSGVDQGATKPAQIEPPSRSESDFRPDFKKPKEPRKRR